MNLAPLQDVLEATGYMSNGEPAPGVRLGNEARGRRGRDFRPDASWRGPAALTVYFKYQDEIPPDDQVSSWRQEVWNEGFAPLLWIVSPGRIDLYNGFGRPLATGDAEAHRLKSFTDLAAQLDALDSLAGRLAMETGTFWQHESRVDRKTGVDHQLLSDLARLERHLIQAKLERLPAQALIGRSIFTQYLVDRGIVSPERLERISGHRSLPKILRQQSALKKLFSWLTDTFNGDMFPSGNTYKADVVHTGIVADFLEGIDFDSGQSTLFPYQFDVIPVELISLIYEQFAHSEVPADTGRKSSKKAAEQGVYYTRLPLVSLVLDEIMTGLKGTETVLDLTCGSGVFLVEALRRLVYVRSGRSQPSREIIFSTLYDQIHGVDISEAAVNVAAFSLYLAALELDPDPQPPEALRFEPLIGRTLLVRDARLAGDAETDSSLRDEGGNLKAFDIIVGNPPWTFRGKEGTASRHRNRKEHEPRQPRGESLDFVQRAVAFSHESTRFGMILSGTPFFGGSKTGTRAVREILTALAPATVVNLASLRAWLFPSASMPAVALLARHRSQPRDLLTVVNVPWSPAGPRTHTFDVTPSDIQRLRLSELEDITGRLKCAAVGSRRDLLLLQRLTETYASLGDRLSVLGAELRDGLILGAAANRRRDARELIGLEFLQTSDLHHFAVPATLPRFDYPLAQWPRKRKTYRSPLLLVKEFIPRNARPIAALSTRDLVFTDAYYGAALPLGGRDEGLLLSGVLSSSLASWFLLMTAAEFGVFKRRVFRNDIVALPIPDLELATRSDPGRQIIRVASALKGRRPGEADWKRLDAAVFDLYQLDDSERVIVRDGLSRATWQWEESLRESVEPARAEAHLRPYASAFLLVIDAWLSARKLRRMRAEILDLPRDAPVRLVRFVLEEHPGPSVIEIIQPAAELRDILLTIGKRLRVPLAHRLVGQRELRVHGRDEVIIVKPAARRHWMGVSALADADAVVSDSMSGAPT